MFEWLFAFLRRKEAKLEASIGHVAELRGLANEFDALADHTLGVISQEQLAAEAEIDTMIAEMTRKKQQIVAGGKRAAEVQTLRAALQKATTKIGDAVDDALETLEDLTDGAN
jgi:ABC-type uncharacterized transport system involved in gliding motility auxiliary subunit